MGMVLPHTPPDNAGNHVALTVPVEDRVDELVQNGQPRRDALRQVTRENMEAEIREGLTDTLQSGAMPGCARACGRLCGIFILFLLISLVVFCICVSISCCIMSIRGWYLTFRLTGCGKQAELRVWLFVYQVLALLEACLASFVRSKAQEIIEALDSRFRPGCIRASAVLCTITSSTLKIFWCVHVQSVVAHAAKDHCDESLPGFMHWYSSLLLLQLLVVEPCVRLGMSLVLWAATTGLLQTSRGAKPGMLESLQVVEYNSELFADASDPTDGRPQRECCFCLEEYDSSSSIVRTPCQHFMHRDCLARWLQTSHFCPICRGDLEEEPQQGQLP